MSCLRLASAACLAIGTLSACVSLESRESRMTVVTPASNTTDDSKADPKGRTAVIARSRVWMPTQVSKMDLRGGPGDPGAFPLRATVECDYSDKKLAGRSPKFACTLGPNDEVKVKFGGANGEVYGEVAATRLMWALGFGADRMYPVRVVCRGCPREPGSIERSGGDQYIMDPAVIERKLPGTEFPEEEGWAWKELDTADPRSGGASRAERDALKLLAVFLQHSDSKEGQQRLVCLDDTPPKNPESCQRPFMMINDVGLTFGKASLFNNNSTSGVNLAAWSSTPVWKEADKNAKNAGQCVGNLPKSFTGTLDDPVISEEGRQFLAELLTQFSDKQLRDLFDVARFNLRVRDPGNARSGFPTIDEWVSAFKQKRDEIVNRRCG